MFLRCHISYTLPTSISICIRKELSLEAMASTSLRMPGNIGVLPSWGKAAKRRSVVCLAAGLAEQYRTLRIQPGASEKDVKKAFRQLALQYHPDVCRGSNCGVQFHRINEAYDTVMNQLRECEEDIDQGYDDQNGVDDEMRGMYDSSWDLWEEWMGWEGAGILDYSSHVNPYI